MPLWPLPPTISPIKTGRTNQNFLVACGGRRYFARVGIDLPAHQISRAIEARCAKFAASNGLAPSVHFAKQGILVTDYIDGNVLSAASSNSNEILENIAKHLATLHALPLQENIPVFDPSDIACFYLNSLEPGRLGQKQLSKIKDILKMAPKLKPTSLIHADLIPENFIDDGERLWLIDWEYAGLGHPATDLALVVMNFDLSDQDLEAFVSFHGNLDPEIVHLTRPVVAVREALWCLIQLQEKKSPQGDLVEYTHMCLRRLGLNTSY